MNRSICALGILFLLPVKMVLADTAPGQPLCGFNQRVMTNAGYNETSTYTGEALRQLFETINVSPRDLTLSPNVYYRTAYSCQVKNNSAKATLRIMPVDGGGVENVVTWKVTKPNYSG